MKRIGSNLSSIFARCMSRHILINETFPKSTLQKIQSSGSKKPQDHGVLGYKSGCIFYEMKARKARSGFDPYNIY